MKWDELTDIQQNALIAEKVEGWQWIPFDFDDVYPMKDQLWLLPDAACVTEITNGEWTWYLEEEEVYPDGSLFPLPHKDKRIVPTWLPEYTTSLSVAWSLVEKLYRRFDVRLFMEEDNTEKYYVQIWMKDGTDRMIGYGSSNVNVQEAIIEAALRSVGVKIE